MTITDLINGHRTALQQHEYALREIAPLAEQLCATLGMHMMLSRIPDSEPMHQLSFWPNEVGPGKSHYFALLLEMLDDAWTVDSDTGNPWIYITGTLGDYRFRLTVHTGLPQ